MTNEQETIEKLEKLGFKTASAKVKRLAEKKKKLAVAYEHYRYVRQEKVDKFNENLRAKTQNTYTYQYYQYQVLEFTSIENYVDVPPLDVLSALEVAKERGCFDAFEVAHIVTVEKLPDPILFGRIDGCTDRFFISQWDEDVKIEQILAPNEG